MPGYKVIFGLGNPGEEYKRTRHNVGQLVLDLATGEMPTPKGLGEDLGLRVVSPFREKTKLRSELAEVELKGEKLLLAKSLTFMNLSGESVGAVTSYFGYAPQEVVVIHDDLDLPQGSLRVKFGGGDGGHKGIRSTISALGSGDFTRIRIGIGRPVSIAAQENGAGEMSLANRAGAVTDWVIGRLSGVQKDALVAAAVRGLDALSELCLNGLQAAQRKFN